MCFTGVDLVGVRARVGPCQSVLARFLSPPCTAAQLFVLVSPDMWRLPCLLMLCGALSPLHAQPSSDDGGASSAPPSGASPSPAPPSGASPSHAPAAAAHAATQSPRRIPTQRAHTPAPPEDEVEQQERLVSQVSAPHPSRCRKVETHCGRRSLAPGI